MVTQAEQIEEILSRKLKPFYWIFAAFTAIYSASQYQSISSVIQNGREIEQKVDKTEFDKAIKERERDYLMKLDYYKMEADEHDEMKECFIFPEKASFILDKINLSMRREMGFNYSTSRDIK